MRKISKIPQRRVLRLSAFDYSSPGAYFVTICTQENRCLFGEVLDGGMVLNGAWEMVHSTWMELPQNYPNIDIDEFIVMPNHVHGIIWLFAPDSVGATPNKIVGMAPHRRPIVGAAPRGRPDIREPAQGPAPTGTHVNKIFTLSDVVHRFNSLTTTRYRYGVIHNGWPRFHKRLWQRNYYEHVIRDERSLNRIREYIANNPLKWDLDRENPKNVRAQGKSTHTDL